MGDKQWWGRWGNSALAVLLIKGFAKLTPMVQKRPHLQGLGKRLGVLFLWVKGDQGVGRLAGGGGGSGFCLTGQGSPAHGVWGNDARFGRCSQGTKSYQEMIRKLCWKCYGLSVFVRWFSLLLSWLGQVLMGRPAWRLDAFPSPRPVFFNVLQKWHLSFFSCYPFSESLLQ